VKPFDHDVREPDRPSGFARLALCLVASMLVALLPRAASAQALVVVSERSPAYDEAVAELRTGLPARDGQDSIEVVTPQELARFNDTALRKRKIVITLGLDAARTTVARDRESLLPLPAPVLCLLIPRTSFESLVPPGARARISAVFGDQPLARQLELLRLALPEHRRVGTVLGPSSRGLLPELEKQSRAREMSLHATEVADASAIYAAMRGVALESDVLFLLPDAVATSADTVYGLMLTSYRAQIPVLGFSESLSKAGALLSLYSSASQQGREGAAIARRALDGDAALPAPRYPRQFTVRINPSVARSLGLQLPDEATLAAALAEIEQAAGEAPPSRAADPRDSP
jgi:ABC-type uncharacterized transport system substrate-binding protein